jgi:hypothetical protein
MSTVYKAVCRCGSSIEVPYSDNFKEWNNFHSQCLKVLQEPTKNVFSVESHNKGFDAGYAKAIEECKTKQKDDWKGLSADDIEGITLAAFGNIFSAIMFTHDKLKDKNT